MRSFQELYDNYFPEIEEKAIQFANENQLELNKNLKIEILESLLKENSVTTSSQRFFGRLCFESTSFTLYSGKKLLLLNDRLDNNQKTLFSQKKSASMF
jgi:hypothetical protein